MRIVRPHLHLLTVAEPLISFHQLEVKCGKVLENALMIYGLALDFRAELARPLGMKICLECLSHASDPPEAEEVRVYEYGLVEKRLWQAYRQSRMGESEDVAEIVA